MHTHFRIPSRPARLHPASTAHIASITTMAFFTRSLQDVPKVTVNDVSRIIQKLCHTSTTKKEKGFKLYVSSYIHNFEGKIWTCSVFTCP